VSVMAAGCICKDGWPATNAIAEKIIECMGRTR
jgi:hypothetical protein